VLEIAEKLQLKTEIRAISTAEFLQADEVFISSSAGGIIPIVQINDRVCAATGSTTIQCHQPYNVVSHMGPLTASHTGVRHRCPYIALEPGQLA
jgi:branched-subunit amino acid aminotransferase/4-amino-4-deoxychorismate lyase